MFARQIARNFSRSVVRMSGHGPEGFPGANVPFSIRNRYVLLGGFIVFFGSGFSAPYFLIRHQLLK